MKQLTILSLATLLVACNAVLPAQFECNVTNAVDQRLTRDIVLDTFITLTECCLDTQQEFAATWTIINSLTVSFPCQNVIQIKQSDLPLVITTSSTTYCLSADVTYTGTGSAITITADQVMLDLNNKQIDISGGSATNAIVVNGAQDVVVTNGTIIAQTGVNTQDVISLVNARNTVVSECVINNGDRAIGITTSQDCIIDSCVTLNPTSTGIFVLTSTHIGIENCITQSGVFGIDIENSNNCLVANYSGNNAITCCINLFNDRDISISLASLNGNAIGIQMQSCNNTLINQCQILNSTNQGINVLNNCNNLVISDCMLNVGGDLIVLNGPGINNVKIIRCQLQQSSGGNGAIYILNGGTEFLIEECIIDKTTGPGINVTSFGSALAFIAIKSCQILNAINLPIIISNSKFGLIEDCLIANSTGGGIVATGSSDFVIRQSVIRNCTGSPALQTSLRFVVEDCLIDRCNAGILIASNNCVVNNCIVQNGGNPVFIQASNVTLTNVISKNNSSAGFNIQSFGPALNNISLVNCAAEKNTDGFNVLVITGKGIEFINCMATGNTNRGIGIDIGVPSMAILNCTCSKNVSHGISINSSSTSCQVRNNILTGNGGFGLTNAAPTAGATAIQAYHNFANNNASGNYSGLNAAFISIPKAGLGALFNING